MPVKKVPLPVEERIARRAAYRFARWLEKNPNATMERRVEKLDKFSDEEFLKETVHAR